MRKVELTSEYDCFRKRWFSDFCAECEAFERCSARVWLKFTMKAPHLARRKSGFLRRAKANFKKQHSSQKRRHPKKRYPEKKHPVLRHSHKRGYHPRYPEESLRKGEKRTYSKRR
jgi:hypothetical protein